MKLISEQELAYLLRCKKRLEIFNKGSVDLEVYCDALEEGRYQDFCNKSDKEITKNYKDA